jgi:VWFA-related protein
MPALHGPHRRHRTLLGVLLTFSFALSLSPLAPLTAQPPSGGGTVVIDSVEVSVVNVDVYVTNRKGEPVAGLSREAFQVLEDGNEAPISNFAFVARSPEAVQTAQTPGAVDESVGAFPVAAPPRDPLHVVIYFDHKNLRAQSRNVLLKQFSGFIDRGLGPDDLVMVVSAGAGLTVHLPFTNDRGALRATLDQIRKGSTERSMVDGEQQRLLSDLDNADQGTMQDALDQLEMAENAQREQARATLNTLQYFVTALAGLPGRKAMLYLSDGIAGTTDEEMAAFGRVAAAANANRVTFYGFDARGWQPDSSINPASRGGNMAALVNNTLNTNTQRPLHELSEATGGFAVTNTTNFDGALEKVSTDLGAYYSLGYTPRTPNDGRYHRIKVKVQGKGLKVRYREGYLARNTKDRLADRTLAALTFNTGDNPLGVELRPAPVEVAADGSRTLPILVQLPVHNLALIPDGEQYTGEVNLLVLIQALDGRMAPVQEIRLPLTLPKAQVEGDKPTNVAYKLSLPIADTGFKVAVGAKDAVSSLESFATIQIGG